MNIESQATKIQPTKSTGQPDRRTLAFTLKIACLTVLFAAGAAVSGCASNHQKLVLDPVGPAPSSEAGIGAANGSLMVFTDYQVTSDFDSLHAASSAEGLDYTGYTWEYSGYKILSPAGTLVKRVPNNVGSGVLHPQQVELPAGKYLVHADAHGYGQVTVPVIIASDRVTVLHLDGEGFWPHEAGFNQTNATRLPDGKIVGWRGLAANLP